MPPHGPAPESTKQAEDRAAWRKFTARVTPRARRASAAAPALATPAAQPATKEAKGPRTEPRSTSQAHRAEAPLVIGSAPAGLDRASWRRFAAGRMRPAASLDLHGLTAARAAPLLEEFVQRASGQGCRTIEVITGRGAGPEGGVIRRELPHWLNRPALRPLILAGCHPHPANPGAVMLLLRRQR